MSLGLSAFDNTVQTTHIWLNELMATMGWQDQHLAYQSLRAVLHALRDRLTAPEAAALGAQLPMLVRGFYYDGWHPHGKPVKERKKEDFLRQIRTGLRREADLDFERVAQVAQAVLELLDNHVTPGEIEKVKRSLPAEIRALWPEKVRVLSL